MHKTLLHLSFQKREELNPMILIIIMKPNDKNQNSKRKMVVNYKECRKNHAANIGRYAVDGCCEFMPAGEEGTASALRCAACGCHRNFHRREVEELYLYFV
ncbi:hypothetical protein LguiA_024361 [Lonicera macranthoides]